MIIFSIEDFRVEFEKLKKKASYASIETDIIDYFFGKDVQELAPEHGSTTVVLIHILRTV